MNWVKLPTLSQASKPDIRVLVGLIANGHTGRPQCTLIVSHLLTKRLGIAKGERADVYVDGDRLKLEFGPELSTKIAFMRWTMIIRCPVPESAPAGARKSALAEILEIADHQVILRLPLAAWTPEAVSASPAPPPARPPAAPPPRPAAAVAPKANGHAPPPANLTPPARPDLGDGRLDVKEYLQRKGRCLTRHPDGHLTMDGEVVTMTHVLGVVNNYRGRSNLPPMTAGDVR